MNLAISPVKLSANNSVSFGMAKFTQEGLAYAKSQEGTYSEFSDPTEFHNAAFYKKKSFFRKAPFATFLESKIKPKALADKESIKEVAQTIIDCGATANSESNAKFTRQLLTTKSYVDKLQPDDKKAIKDAAISVFATNWNNPELTKEETKALARFAFDDSTMDGKKILSTIDGVIENSDAPTPKRHK